MAAALHAAAGLKRQDNTSTGAAPHLLSKRTLCYQVSRIRTAKLCYEHSRGIDPRELPCELIDPRYLYGRTGESIHVRGVSFLNRISIIRSSL